MIGTLSSCFQKSGTPVMPETWLRYRSACAGEDFDPEVFNPVQVRFDDPHERREFSFIDAQGQKGK